jgi:hypothetical protein
LYYARKRVVESFENSDKDVKSKEKSMCMENKEKKIEK